MVDLVRLSGFSFRHARDRRIVASGNTMAIGRRNMNI